MNKTTHKIYTGSFFFIAAAVTILLAVDGFNYYTTSLEERFFHLQHTSLKPSGYYGHGYGIAGSMMMILGVSIYMIRKRIKRLFRLGYLKHWLEFHIFLCTLGPILVLYHTAFKFGGLVAVSFWSMVAVVFSGVIGRFIYIQIPRTIQGQEMSIREITQAGDEYTSVLNRYSKSPGILNYINAAISTEKYRGISLRQSFVFLLKDFFKIRTTLRVIKKDLLRSGISKPERKEIIEALKYRMIISRRIGLLRNMQSLFRYWHIVHLPFAIVMFVILILHVAVTIIFGYRWIF